MSAWLVISGVHSVKLRVLFLFCYPISQLHSAELTSIWSWYGVRGEGAGGCLVLSHHTSFSTAQGTRQTSPLLGCKLPSLVSTVPQVTASVPWSLAWSSSAFVLPLSHPQKLLPGHLPPL